MILQTIEETRAAGGTGLVWYTGDAISPSFMDDVLTQIREDKRPRSPGLRARRGPETARPPRPKRRRHPVRHERGRPSPHERRRDRRLPWVDPGRSGDARLPARALGARHPPTKASGRRESLVRPPVSGLRPEPTRRRARDREYRGRGADRRDGPPVGRRDAPSAPGPGRLPRARNGEMPSRPRPRRQPGPRKSQHRLVGLHPPDRRLPPHRQRTPLRPRDWGPG